jgi:leader peptidase (prepilin peptidase) / N-methyltransferase
MADQIIAVTIFFLGASIGSFLNVVIYRLPAGLSLLWPPSRCPKCGHQLGITENVPILGWLMLRGRCRHCHTKISARYPLVETLTAIAFVFTYSQFGLTTQTLGYCLLLAWLIALSLIDLDTMTLPNSLTSSGLVLGLIFQTYWGYQVTQSQVGAVHYLVGSISGMVLGIWLYDIIQVLGSLLLGQSAQGGGDAKLMGLLGAWLGWQNVLLTGAIASGTGSLIIGGAMVLGFWRRDQKFPLGPFLALGGVISLFAGDRLISTYQNVMFSMSPSTNALLAGFMLIVLISYLVYVRSSKRRVKNDAGDD